MPKSSYVPIRPLFVDQYIVRQGEVMAAMNQHEDLRDESWGDAYLQDVQDAGYCLDASDRPPAGSLRRSSRGANYRTVLCLVTPRFPYLYF